ncbi:50S ribosomal protein L25 [Opitutales bacterium]|nr:50S ribosomal protein L25 [Opitutales bacterium]MDB3958951.1 50S ribosomal protein L25 [Opitutales bacterium]
MSNITETILKVDSRVKHGTSLSKKLRSQGRIPAVFYGKDILKHYSVDDSKFRALMRSSGGTLSLIELQEDSGDKELALLKDIQIDSVKDNILHLDFVQVTRGQTLETKIPLELVGESIGVKSMGGILEFHQSEILVRCRPSQLPKGLELDISGLDLGDSLQIRNLPVIEGVEYVADPEGNIVTCVSSASGRAGADDETDEGASGEPSSEGDDSVTPDSGSNAEGSE